MGASGKGEHEPGKSDEIDAQAVARAVLKDGVEKFPVAYLNEQPIPCSSGKRTKHRLNPGGDRQLNHALHVIAICRARHDPATKEYLARKEAEGKTRKGALRSLKRHLARHFHHLLAEPPADQQPTTQPKPIIEPELPAIPDRPNPRRDVEQITTAPCPMVYIG
jgi:hypothetical protein